VQVCTGSNKKNDTFRACNAHTISKQSAKSNGYKVFKHLNALVSWESTYRENKRVRSIQLIGQIPGNRFMHGFCRYYSDSTALATQLAKAALLVG